jgi:hypothetical protein
MKKIYICSPYRGDIERNVSYARDMMRAVIDAGCIPVVPHLLLTQVLNDDNADERAKGLALGINMMDGCDLVLVCMLYGASSGMVNEIKHAIYKNIRHEEVLSPIDAQQILGTRPRTIGRMSKTVGHGD